MSTSTETAAPPTTGSAGPQPGIIPVPDSADRLPRRTVRAGVEVWWVGAHGGAGETTLAQLLPGSEGTGHAWPRPARSTGAPTSLPVVLVARTSWGGLTAAQRALTEWASGSVDHVHLLGLVLLADAPGRTPRPLKDLASLVAGGAPRVWHIPWVEAWRISEDASTTQTPKAVRRLIDDIDTLTTPTSPARAQPKEVAP